MIRLVVSNQRGGVAKTTTVHTLARFFADKGLRVLVLDTDPQGSMAAVLGLKAPAHLHQFVIHNHVFKDCLVEVHPNIDILCSNRETSQTENILMGQLAREMAFVNLFPKVDQPYSIVLVDVAPSITLLQTCAMIYARQVLIPVAMDPLSLQGAVASVETARMLNGLFQTTVRPIAFLPVMIDRRLQMTQVILESLSELSRRFAVPILHGIRTDSTVTKSARARQFLGDYDPKCRALEDYCAAGQQLLDLLKGQLDGDRELQIATA